MKGIGGRFEEVPGFTDSGFWILDSGFRVADLDSIRIYTVGIGWNPSKFNPNEAGQNSGLLVNKSGFALHRSFSPENIGRIENLALAINIQKVKQK